MQNDTLTLRLTALDTLFFRESRPFENIGGIELSGTFPPPARTVLGAIRSVIGESMGIDWSKFTEKSEDETAKKLRAIIGFGDDYASLKLEGLWLFYKGKPPKREGDESDIAERLYPVPALLLRKQEDNQDCFARLSLGEPTCTHLGRVRLPMLSKDKQGYKNLEQHWITHAGLKALLQGDVPVANTLFNKADLFTRESRLGININQTTRSTGQDNGLFQAEHVRPKPQLAIDVELSGLKNTMSAFKNGTVLRLGAEGRLSGLSIVDDEVSTLAALKVTIANRKKPQGLILILLTPAYFANETFPWLPDGFKLPDGFDAKKDTQRWQGKIKDIDLTIHAAVIGKTQREGGWDAANRQPRPMQSLIPAGSCYYCTVKGDIQAAIDTLHDTAIGQDTHLGRGRIVCALWSNSDFQG
jgi:CRISPR-associated protein Cmr3